MTDLIEWLTAQLDADERIALAASQDRQGSTPTGEHWRWECSNCDTAIEITDVVLLDEHLMCPACDGWAVALRSVEEYPTASVGPLSHFVVSYAEEQRPVDALHIQRHDPAHVLRTIAAHRAVLAEVARVLNHPGGQHRATFMARRVLAPLLSIYSDRPGFDPSWRAESGTA